jgi:hypothetical protein
MPGGDGTGPMGLGPMTGRPMGYCAGFPVPGHMNPTGWFFGRGRRFWGRGGGQGWRHMFYATGLPGWLRFGGVGAAPTAPPPDLEKRFLKNQAEALQAELDGIKKRLAELEAEKPQ